jgi:hypothetical protein
VWISGENSGGFGSEFSTCISLDSGVKTDTLTYVLFGNFMQPKNGPGAEPPKSEKINFWRWQREALKRSQSDRDSLDDSERIVRGKRRQD